MVRAIPHSVGAIQNSVSAIGPDDAGASDPTNFSAIGAPVSAIAVDGRCAGFVMSGFTVAV
jgi:hypothetical protein